jgi:flavin-dependent dehydrogenase
VGAGPAGLIGALVLEQEGFEVIVLEKRSGDFNRLNKVNLKGESESVLNQLNLLRQFQAEVGTQFQRHDYFRLFNNQEEKFHTEVVESLAGTFENEISFETTDSKDRFKADGLYTVTIAEFEQFLAKAAISRGVSIVTDIELAQLIERSDTQSKGIFARQKNQQERTFFPHLILLADGSNGETGSLRYRVFSESNSPHPCHGEKWIFGNVDYLGSNEAFVSVLLDYSNEHFTRAANVIFEPKHKEVNVAVLIERDDISPSEIKEIIESTADRAFAMNKIPGKAKAKFTSSVVSIVNKVAHKFTMGDNVIIAGDRAGVSSPLAGLGATLAVTSYPYGIRKVAQAIQRESIDGIRQSLSDYNEQTKAYVYEWLEKSATIKQFIENMPMGFLLTDPIHLTTLARQMRYHFSRSIHN